jgi:hypothetical protein
MPRSAPIIIALTGLSLLGCSTKVHETTDAPGFAAALATTPVIGVAGVTVAPDVGGVLAPDDQDAADEALYGALLAGQPDPDAGRTTIDVWHPGTVTDLASVGALADLADAYARLGRLRSDDVQAMAASLSGCRFLAFGRLIDDEIGSNTHHQELSDPEARAEGQGEHRSAFDRLVTVERTATVTLELFDLESGASVWRGEARSRDRQQYEYADDTDRTSAAELQRRLAAPDEPVYLSRTGEALRTPDLIELMRRAFTELVERLSEVGA